MCNLVKFPTKHKKEEQHKSQKPKATVICKQCEKEFDSYIIAGATITIAGINKEAYATINISGVCTDCLIGLIISSEGMLP